MSICGAPPVLQEKVLCHLPDCNGVEDDCDVLNISNEENIVSVTTSTLVSIEETDFASTRAVSTGDKIKRKDLDSKTALNENSLFSHLISVAITADFLTSSSINHLTENPRDENIDQTVTKGKTFREKTFSYFNLVLELIFNGFGSQANIKLTIRYNYILELLDALVTVLRNFLVCNHKNKLTVLRQFDFMTLHELIVSGRNYTSKWQNKG